jgi:hypothetical protein
VDTAPLVSANERSETHFPGYAGFLFASHRATILPYIASPR